MPCPRPFALPVLMPFYLVYWPLHTAIYCCSKTWIFWPYLDFCFRTIMSTLYDRNEWVPRPLKFTASVTVPDCPGPERYALVNLPLFLILFIVLWFEKRKIGSYNLNLRGGGKKEKMVSGETPAVQCISFEGLIKTFVDFQTFLDPFANNRKLHYFCTRRKA